MPARSQRPAGFRHLIDSSTEPAALSDQLEVWLRGTQPRTLGSLVRTFGKKSFAVLVVVLLALPALPLPTGGVTHVLELIGAVLALEMITGRREVWLPKRWEQLELAGARQERFISRLIRLIRRLERISKPRLRSLFQRRLAHTLFGLLVLAGTIGAFASPPFSGLDTLPSLGTVILALSVLLEDALIAAAGIAILMVGIALEVALGSAAIHGVSSLL